MEAPGYYYCFPTSDKSSAASAAGEPFLFDDLLDFSNAESVPGAGFFHNAAASSTDSSVVAAIDGCNSSVCGDNGGTTNYNSSGGDSSVCLNGFYGAGRGFGGDCKLSGELCVPCDDLAELEWLSNFFEDSFSAKQPSLFFPGSPSSNAPTPLDSSPVFLPEPTPPPSKSQSKRPRTIPCDWTTRLLHPAAPPAAAEPSPRAASSKRETSGGQDAAPRRCLHCAAEKTPQWRTGPLGLKTLCNACGVRYKSGRLVPEYRPAASPTFISTKHSNSHRKVIELRRQKDLQRVHPQFTGPGPMFGSGNGSGHGYLIGGGAGYRHMI
ncbi:hypothetical protein MLD38_030216 [Melastoma candidum]|uniref:Uncharacterized protein n=1 Tax=Melastoma candidum TaxID=119954 RepID=A0ACB9MN22_9MYRT|nr:hypothetical protein MLD38_030216 [Melastoma candidum]